MRIGMQKMDKLEKSGIKPVVLDEIKRIAEEYEVKRVILFGSRARGDYHRASDIDLAVEGGRITDFILDVKEATSTLLNFDIVDLEKTAPGKFSDAIKKEGIVLYEKI